MADSCTNSMAVTIRAGITADIPSVAAIECVSFVDPWSPEQIRQSLAVPQGGALVAEGVDGAVAGYCFFWTVVDETEIHSLGVDPACRRRGVASAIIERLLADCLSRGVVRVLLEVRYSNQGALALYHRHGFSIDTVRPKYYPDGEDAVLMSRRLA